MLLVIFNADPALVFGEILGVIKGSEEAIGTQNRCLDQDTYISKRGQIFSYRKEAIYDIFTAYTRMKRKYQEHDAADRSALSKYSPDSKVNN